MRDKFSELIAKGVAVFNPKPVAGSTPELDPMCKTYNAVWGLLSDTHMSKIEDGYIITGTFTQSPVWDNFKYSTFWGSTNIKLASGYSSLDAMVAKNSFTMVPDLYNGDRVMRLKPVEVPPNAENGCGCCGCCTDCPVCCSVGESKIPHPLSDVFSHDQIVEFKTAWVDAKGDANKIVENLQSSKVLDGSKFYISSDQKYLVGEGSQIIKFVL